MHTNPAERMNGARTTVSLASNDVQVMELGYSRNQESMREVVRRWGDTFGLGFEARITGQARMV